MTARKRLGRAAPLVGRLMTMWLGSTQPRLVEVGFAPGGGPRPQRRITLPPQPLVFIACPELWPEHVAEWEGGS